MGGYPGQLFHQFYDNLANTGPEIEGEFADIAYIDPRIPNYGISVISFKENQIENRINASGLSLKIGNEDDYNLDRLMRYVFEVILSV